MKHFKKIESKFLFSLLIMSVWSIIAVGQTTAKISKHIPEIEKWIQKQFAKGKTPPFSFICDGKPSAEFIRQWDYSQQKIESEEADVIKYLFTYYNPTNGLKVECTVKGYPSYQAAEWVLNFTNKGTSNSPTLEQVKVVDLAMQYASKGEFKLHYADGNHISKYDFHPRSVTLATGETKQMSPQGGRSSEGDYLPFFNIESPAGQGVILGVGWSGTWYADVCAQDNRTISMASGMKTMKLYLRPQETIRTPSISLMFWENIDRMAGHNKFRRFSPGTQVTENQRKICRISSFQRIQLSGPRTLYGILMPDSRLCHCHGETLHTVRIETRSILAGCRMVQSLCRCSQS